MLHSGRIGFICLPTDPVLRTQLLNMSNTARKYDLLSVISTFFTSLWVAVVMGVLCFLIIQYQPQKVVPWVIFLGGLVCIFFGIAILTYFIFISRFPGYIVVKIVLCVLLVGLGIISLRAVFVQERRDAVALCARFLHAATLTHSDRNIVEKDKISC